jgi:lipopolysaccharide transport system permease protein
MAKVEPSPAADLTLQVPDVPAADVPVIQIEPSRGWFNLQFAELWTSRELLYFLIWRDVKVRYKQTLIGAAWTILQPLMTMAILTVVFANFANMPSDGLPYPLFCFAALLPWNYFSRSLSNSIVSVTSNANLVTKIYFPRVLLPLSATLSGLLDFAIALGFFVLMMVWYGVAPSGALIFFPAFVVLAVLASLSISLWLSVINVRYRDVGQAVPFLIQLWMFASPIAYPMSIVPERWQMLYSLNPVTMIVEGFRWTLLGKPAPPTLPLVISTAVVLILLWGGIIFFRRMEQSFADVV